MNNEQQARTRSTCEEHHRQDDSLTGKAEGINSRGLKHDHHRSTSFLPIAFPCLSHFKTTTTSRHRDRQGKYLFPSLCLHL